MIYIWIALIACAVGVICILTDNPYESGSKCAVGTMLVFAALFSLFISLVHGVRTERSTTPVEFNYLKTDSVMVVVTEDATLKYTDAYTYNHFDSTSKLYKEYIYNTYGWKVSEDYVIVCGTIAQVVR